MVNIIKYGIAIILLLIVLDTLYRFLIVLILLMGLSILI